MHYFENGKIVIKDKWYQKQIYDIANRKVMCQVDGLGNLSKYSIANRFQILKDNSFYISFVSGSESLPENIDKVVKMIGRRQSIESEFCKINSFLDESNNSVYLEYEFKEDSSVYFGYIHDLNAFKLYKVSQNQLPPSISWPEHSHSKQELGFLTTNHIGEGYDFNIASNVEILLKEEIDGGYHYQVEVKKGQPLRLVLSAALDTATYFNVLEGLSDFDNVIQQNIDYERQLVEFISHANEGDKALFASSLNCALSSYKEIDDFKGFFAGINYQAPARTYYRDSYYTCLPILPLFPNLVREQILTLASGVGSDGTCPSAVIAGGKKFWNHHLDSPMYLTILVYDYINATKDEGVLIETIGDVQLIELLRRINDGLIEKLDENNLLYREENNRHDWCDNVYRCGYVTYVEALLYQSLKAFGNLTGEDKYLERSQKVKRSINALLWDTDKGYFVNYKNEFFLEDHLSIDTILTVYFDIADEERKQSILTQMENLLESKHNNGQEFGDWGVLSVYPFYKYKEHLVEKSSYDYQYHNGSDWPYLSGLYALAKKMNHREYHYPASRWFHYGIEQGWYTPVEYYNPITGRGSLLQGWSAMALCAFLIDKE